MNLLHACKVQYKNLFMKFDDSSKTIIPADLVIYHLISNAHSFNNCYVYG